MHESSVLVTIFSDFTCPFSYVTEVGLRKRAAEGGVEIVYRAFELYPAPAPLPTPETPGTWEHALRPLAQAVDIEVRAQQLQPRTRKAHEATFFARERGVEEPLRAAIFEAYWREGRDVGRIDVLVELGHDVGLDRTELKIALDIDRYADAVLRDRAIAAQTGVDAVPALVVGAGPDAEVLVGAQSYQGLRLAIHEALPGR